MDVVIGNNYHLNYLLSNEDLSVNVEVAPLVIRTQGIHCAAPKNVAKRTSDIMSAIEEMRKNAIIELNKEIVNKKNINKIKLDQNNLCFHAGTKSDQNKIFAIGGRVLNFVSLSESFLDAKKNIINNLNSLEWNDGFYRKDIGYKVID